MTNSHNPYLNAFSVHPSKENMHSLCAYIQQTTFNKSLISELTKLLAYSGEVLNFNDVPTADIPSTGGPSSLSTIICPLILKEYYTVPKLGIVGRPAGGIDVLRQIDGYNIKLSSENISLVSTKN